MSEPITYGGVLAKYKTKTLTPTKRSKDRVSK
jgi:hypothetical protein